MKIIHIKFALFLFATIFKISQGTDWNGRIYPIAHNTLCSSSSASTFQSNNIWYVIWLNHLSLNVYQDQNILITYLALLSKSSNAAINSNSFSNVLVKIDHLNGITIWAKEYFYQIDSLFYDIK